MNYSTWDLYPTGNHAGLSALDTVVRQLRYKKGWSFDFMGIGGGGRMLRITIETEPSPNSNYARKPGDPFLVSHLFPVPPDEVLYSMSPDRWLLECIIRVERHEAMEYFMVDGKQPFYPAHFGEDHAGGDPYCIARREELPDGHADPHLHRTADDAELRSLRDRVRDTDRL